MGLASFTFIIDGTTVDPPRDWQDIDILASFDNRAMQANISTEQFTFVNNGAQLLINYIEAGKTGGRGIFEGLPIQIYGNDNGNALTVFDGYMDFNTYEELSPVEVKCGIKKLNGMNSFAERAEATTYSYLNSKGLFPANSFVKVPFVVEKETDPLAILMMVFTLYQLTVALIESIVKIVDSIRGVIKAATPDLSVSPTPNTGAIISAILLVIINLFTAILIGIAMTELTIQLISILISPVRPLRAMYERTLLEKATEFLGYKFISPIEELDQTVFLPSSPSDDGLIILGLPKAADFGYRVSEMFEIMHKKYNAKTAIIGNEVHLRSLNDPFWRKTSTYVMPDVLDETRKYNTEDLKANILVRFAIDQSDEHTVDNFKGTVYEVITEPISVTNKEMILIKGLDEISIPLALGSRKNKLSDVEKAIKPLALFADGIINALGGSSSMSKNIDQRVGMLKISQKIYYTAKTLPFIDGAIPKNPRSIIGAKALYNKYINERSFIANGFARQRRVITGLKIPFGMVDFLKLEKNSFFVTQNGTDGEVLKILWRLGSDFAVLDFEIEEIYTTNLKEITVEPA